MAHIAPFRALRYDPSRVELGQVITQPYDKITPAMQDRYYTASPFNLVRIILGKSEPGDSPSRNTYTRAQAFFRDWRKQGVLGQDEQPSVYRYVQQFKDPASGATLERRGFIALGRIEDYSANVVFRHEQTLAKPKADRLNLLRATRAHFGQIFMLYSDAGGEIDELLAPVDDAAVNVTDEYGVVHHLAVVSDPAAIESLRTRMADKQLIIADGHHRYETALNYRNEQRESVNSADTQSAPYDFVMMTFVRMESPGLLILPTHRVVHGLTSFSADDFRTRARQYFSVDEADAAMNARRATGLLKAAGQAGTAMLAVTADRVFLIDTPRGVSARLMTDLSVRQQSLDVVQLHRCLLQDVLGISEEAIREQKNISYVRDIEEAMSLVRSGGANIAFLMNPVKMARVREIAFAGEVLPQKSTDFYPKMLSGLTIYALE
ncbi:MAG TPA: DUF1015 domain-containing protein [Terriglobales bacterium]